MQAPLKTLPFKLVPLMLLFLLLALANRSVNGVCYQHTKTCLVRVHLFTARGWSPPLLLNTAELAGRELAQAWPPRGLCRCSAHFMLFAADLLLTIKHCSVGSGCSLTSFTPRSSLCLWCGASSRQAVCSSSPSNSQGHLCFL